MQVPNRRTHKTFNTQVKSPLPDYFLSFQCLVVFPAISKLTWHNSTLVRSILHNKGVVLWHNAVRLTVFLLGCVSIVWQLTLVSVAYAMLGELNVHLDKMLGLPNITSHAQVLLPIPIKNCKFPPIRMLLSNKLTHPVKLCMPAPTVDRNEPMRITHFVGGQAISATTMTLSILRPNLQQRVTQSWLTISLSFISSHERFSNSMKSLATRLTRQK